jgi:hypothetical protein
MIAFFGSLLGDKREKRVQIFIVAFKKKNMLFSLLTWTTKPKGAAQK